MAQWMVELSGPAVDLQQLARELQAPEFCVIEEEGKFLLKASEFSSMASDAEVWRRAMEIVEQVNALVSMHDPGFDAIQPDHVLEILDDGRRIGQKFADAAVRVRVRLAGVGTVTGQGATQSQRPARLPSGLSIAAQNSLVAEVLRYLSRLEERRAMNLYKVWEIIGKDVTGSTRGQDWKRQLVTAGWATAAEVESFRSIHDPGVLGEEARHAVQSRPSPVDPWTLAEAESFIRRVTLEWLRSKGYSG